MLGANVLKSATQKCIPRLTKITMKYYYGYKNTTLLSTLYMIIAKLVTRRELTFLSYISNISKFQWPC